jgi:cytochrome P450
MIALLALIALVILLLVIGLTIYIRWEYGVLEQMGIPVVKHHPLLGSSRELYEKVGGLNDIKWMKEYGKIFGVYEGRQPQVFVGVPELVRLICVKDADYFNDKRRLEFGDPVLNEMPDFQEYEKWKLLRSFATPAFTSAKLKMMNLPMTQATQDFISGLKQKIKSSPNKKLEKFTLNTAIHTMLTDLISRCVFSIRISNQDEENNEFAKLVHDLVSPPTENQNTELLIWSHSLPFLKKLLPAIFKPEPVAKFVKIFKQMMEERRRTGVKHNDVVDMCLDWYDRLDSPEFKKAKINELSIFCQALVFFFAAQDQVSTQVTMAIFHMIQDPEIERKLYQEIDAVFSKHNGKLEHEHLSELVYTNACINEALRMYPFFYRAERVCTKDWHNEEYNLSIKKGMTIQFPLWAINRCSEYNPEGDKFIPDRFMPENKDKLNIYSSTSFGFGPRNCTGKKFATEAMPLILAYLLKDLKFVKTEDTKLKFVPGGPFFQPYEPICVDVMLRNDKDVAPSF